LFGERATSGCSRPSTFSRIASEPLDQRLGLAIAPLDLSTLAQIVSSVATAGCSGPRFFVDGQPRLNIRSESP